MDYILQVNQLHKRYKDVNAVNGISFGIPQGICFGLLGPNGAGKTTTIEIIEGVIRESSGEILYKGKLRDKTFAQQIGIQFQSTALPDFLTVREVIELFSSFYSQPQPLQKLVELCELADFIDREANKLSGGQKQRLLLALALINDPEIVFLDEPTTGLDPQSRRKFWDLMTMIKSRGKTIVLTTHYMEEAELLCDELIIIDHGEIVVQGSPRQLLDTHLPHKRVCVDQQNVPFNSSNIVGEINLINNEIEITTSSVEQTLQALMAQRFDMSSLRVRNPTLEDLFIHLTGHQLRD
ncbi:ABC transporter, ATP-binding protein [marine gamma proteobacterium HTCC2143]|jgi:ABC-2 type transport system ATP-binding protein|uniref:ABC transporter, ATP-binding protein n=1 Tax=marine gamma proteobacterium HTCC2143 TaxID=247633 RepID=A0YHU0_9GAMM|nr:ABC transporter, ATP-binding protein [marine gamma proteobacterium HTCC2143]